MGRDKKTDNTMTNGKGQKDRQYDDQMGRDKKTDNTMTKWEGPKKKDNDQ